MAGHVRLLIAASACCAFAGALAQAPASPPDKDGPPSKRHKRDHDHSPEMENVRKAIDALTPEQRQRFSENLMRWSQMPPEEKKSLRDREEVRKKFMTQELDTAIAESGLQLDGDRREQFMKRYGEERRKIEEQLRKEMGEKRKPLLIELIARLKAEFSAPAPPAQ